MCLNNVFLLSIIHVADAKCDLRKENVFDTQLQQKNPLPNLCLAFSFFFSKLYINLYTIIYCSQGFRKWSAIVISASAMLRIEMKPRQQFKTLIVV